MNKSIHGTLLAGTASAISLVVYLFTMAPTLTWAHYDADGGDLVNAVVQGSIPHPPGFPTYLLLGELFTRLPWGDPAWRLNLMSAVLAAGAVGLTTATIRSVLQRTAESLRPMAHISVPLVAGLCLGFAPRFWSQALITEVYAPAAFFAALVMALSIRKAPAWVLGLSWGIGLGAHLTLLFLAPLVAWGVWGKRTGRPLRLAAAYIVALLSWGALYGLVLLARGSVPSPWGNVSTLHGWWALVSGRLYRGYLFGLPLADLPLRLLAWAGLMARQFTPVGAVLAGLGMVQLWRRWRPIALMSSLAFGALNVYAVGYNTIDSLVYLATVLPFAALWLGIGLSQVVDWLGNRLRRDSWLRYGTWALLLLPLIQVVLFWGGMDVSENRTAMEWAEQVLEHAPAQAILLTDQDKHTFTLWYAHDALGKRPDVTVIDTTLWNQEPYREMMIDALGLSADTGSLSLEEATFQAERPVVHATNLAVEEGAP